MERQYTREQIVKALKHWSRILQRMDETNADKQAFTVVDALIAEFGEDRVKSAKTDYKLNAHYKLETILGEEQDSTTAVYESGGMVIVRAKGSSKSALFNFD